jgi:hypothetical protein
MAFVPLQVPCIGVLQDRGRRGLSFGSSSKNLYKLLYIGVKGYRLGWIIWLACRWLAIFVKPLSPLKTCNSTPIHHFQLSTKLQ